MSAIQTLIDVGVLTAWQGYRSGCGHDWSGGGEDGTPTDIVWTRLGASLNGTTSKITTASADPIGVGAFSAIFTINPRTHGGGSAGRLLDNGQAILQHSGGSQILFTSNGYGVSLATTSGPIILGSRRCVGVSRDAAGAAEIYIDGVTNKSGPSGTPVAGSTQAVIGGRVANDRGSDGTFGAALLFSRVLTPTEHAAVYAELADMRWPQKQSRGEAHYMGRERLLDGAAAYTTGNSAVITDITDGMRVAYGGVNDPYALQNILPSNTLVRVVGYARGDGVSKPRVGSNSAFIWTGTASMAWQAIDEVFYLTNGLVYFYSICTSGWVEFKDLEVRELISDRRTEWDDRRDGTLLWGTDWGTPVTANRTAGQRVGPFEVISGTHKVVTDTIEGKICKAIECVVSGVIAIPVGRMRQLPSDAAYGTWELWVNKANASSVHICFAALTQTWDNYEFRFHSDETIGVYDVGAVQIISGGSLVHSVWNQIRISRSPAGLFTLYANGVSVGTGTNTTHTTALYWVADLDAGDKIALADVGAGHSMLKYQGVVTP